MHRHAKLALFGTTLALVAGAGYSVFQSRARAITESEFEWRSKPAVARAAPGTIADPLTPGRPATLDTAPRPDAGDWRTARPGFQYSRPASERGGIEPCSSQPVDTSA